MLEKKDSSYLYIKKVAWLAQNYYRYTHYGISFETKLQSFLGIKSHFSSGTSWMTVSTTVWQLLSELLTKGHGPGPHTSLGIFWHFKMKYR